MSNPFQQQNGNVVNLPVPMGAAPTAFRPPVGQSPPRPPQDPPPDGTLEDVSRQVARFYLNRGSLTEAEVSLLFGQPAMEAAKAELAARPHRSKGT